MFDGTYLNALKQAYGKPFGGLWPFLLLGLGAVIAVGCARTPSASRPAPPPPPTRVQPAPAPPRPPVRVQPAPANPFQAAIAEQGERCYKGRKDLVAALAEHATSSLVQAHTSGFTDALHNVDTIGGLPTLVAFRGPPSFVRSDTSPGVLLLAQSMQQAQRKAIRDLEQLGKLADIEVVRFKKDRSELLIVGPAALNGQGLRYDDWLAVFQAIALKGAPGVSIDPGPNPDSMVVRYFGGIESTHLGDVFFEADRTLKLLSTGFDNLNCAKFALMPSNMPTELQLMDAEMRRSRVLMEGGWHRFWFEPTDESVEVSPDGLSMRLPSKRVVVQEEPLPGSGGSSGSAKEFAALVSNNFLDLTTKIPAFAELQRQAALVRLAQWMVDKQIPVDQSWLEHAPETVQTPDTTPTITVTKATIESRVYVRVGIHGGVDFRKPNTYVQTRGFSNCVLRATEQGAPRGEGSWSFTCDGRQYRAVRLQYEKPVVLQPMRKIWGRSIPVTLPLPKPYFLVLPSFEEASRGLSGQVGTCRQLSLGADVFVRGEAYVWDKTKNSVDKAFELIPEAVRATPRSGRLTLFIIHERRQKQVGTYTISGQPAYREDLEVSIQYWPEETCVGSIKLSAEPPSQRVVQYVPGYGSVKLAEWIGKLRRGN